MTVREWRNAAIAALQEDWGAGCLLRKGFEGLCLDIVRSCDITRVVRREEAREYESAGP